MAQQNKFKNPAIGYAVKYNGVVVPQSFVLGTDSHQRILAKRLFTSWARDRNMWGVTFKSAEVRGEVILIKLKEMKA